VELTNNNSFRAVDDKGTTTGRLVGHQGKIAEVYICLKSIVETSQIVRILPAGEAENCLQGCGIGHTPLSTFFHRVFRWFYVILHEFEYMFFPVVDYGEDVQKDSLQAFFLPFYRGDVCLQEVFIRLNLYIQ